MHFLEKSFRRIKVQKSIRIGRVTDVVAENSTGLLGT